MNSSTRHQKDSSRRASRVVRGVVAGLVAIGVLMIGRSPRADTGTLVPALYQTVLDANGNPVAGAKICTYLSGTSTPVATYTDVNLTVPAANPIIADTAGRWATYLTTGVSYRFVLQDATGTAGVCNGAVIRTIDTVAAVPGTANPTVAINTADLRLTLTPGVPVTTADVTGATSVYVTPYSGNRIALYDGATWNLRTVTETAIPVPALASTVWDVFAYDTLTVPTYGLVQWNTDTARSLALGLQDGVLSLASAPTRRYLGTIRTGPVAGQVEDSGAKRYVSNYAHRVRRPLLRLETVAGWTYTVAAYRQANANALNQVEVVVGVAEVPISLTLVVGVINTAGGVLTFSAIGEDSTTVAAVGQLQHYLQAAPANTYSVATATLNKLPGIGRHVYTWLEYSTATGVTTWNGFSGNVYASGLSGWIEN